MNSLFGYSCLVLVAEANSILGLVEDGSAGGSVNLAVLGAAHLVADFLASGLVVIGLDATVEIVSEDVQRVRGCVGVLTERPCRQSR